MPAGRRLERFLWLISGLVLATVAMMRPQLGFRERPVSREGINLLIALDVSRSMLADDIAPSRLERARLFIEDLLDVDDRVRIAAE